MRDKVRAFVGGVRAFAAYVAISVLGQYSSSDSRSCASAPPVRIACLVSLYGRGAKSEVVPCLFAATKPCLLRACLLKLTSLCEISAVESGRSHRSRPNTQNIQGSGDLPRLVACLAKAVACYISSCKFEGCLL